MAGYPGRAPLHQVAVVDAKIDPGILQPHSGGYDLELHRPEVVPLASRGLAIEAQLPTLQSQQIFVLGSELPREAFQHLQIDLRTRPPNGSSGRSESGRCRGQGSTVRRRLRRSRPSRCAGSRWAFQLPRSRCDSSNRCQAERLSEDNAERACASGVGWARTISDVSTNSKAESASFLSATTTAKAAVATSQTGDHRGPDK